MNEKNLISNMSNRDDDFESSNNTGVVRLVLLSRPRFACAALQTMPAARNSCSSALVFRAALFVIFR